METKPKQPEATVIVFEEVTVRVTISLKKTEHHEAALAFVRKISVPGLDMDEQLKDTWCGFIDGIMISQQSLTLDFYITALEAERPLNDLVASISNELVGYGLPGHNSGTWMIG